MSQTAHIPSHRKPRRAASSTRALRAGVTGGFLTLAVAGAATPALAAEPAAAESTLEMPTIGDTLASTAAQSADATQQAAFDYQLQAQQDQAAAKAKTAAKKAKVEADRKAREAKEAARKAAARRAAQEKAERASRTAERTSLSTATSNAASGATSTATQATGNAATLINFLKAQLGKAYVLGSSGPSSYDCSGLTQAAFNQIGISLPRVSQDQSAQGTAVSLDNLQPGDLLYWGGRGSAYHVGVYIGGGKFIGAQNPSTGIVERSLSYDPPTGAVRLL